MSTSALPEREESARLPCFATGTPAPATMKAAQVEMLKEPEASPPVPTTSMASAGAGTVSIFARIAVTAPVISSTDSPRTRSAISRPPICDGVTSPDIMLSKASNAASRLNAAPVATCPISALMSAMLPSMRPARIRRHDSPIRSARPVAAFHWRGEIEEILQDEMAVLGSDALGMKLHAVHRKRAVLQRHHQAVAGLRGDCKIVRHRGALDHERMIARRLERAIDTAEHAFSLVAHLGELAVDGDRRAHHLAAERLADRLVAEADTEHRNGRCRLVDELEADAGVVGGARTRRQHDGVGIGGHDLGARNLVVAVHDDVGAQPAEIMDEVEGEAVVIVDEDDHSFHPGSGPAGRLPRQRGR